MDWRAATVAAVALLFGARAWAEPATGTMSGSDCPGVTDANTEAIADLGATLSAAELAAKDCIPEGDARRPFAEENERRALENRFGDFVRAICEDRICVNNGWGFVLDAFDDQAYDEKTLMAGCGRWAGEVASSAQEAKPKYWEIREAQYGKGSGRPGYHWVVEMRNTRTGETFLLDGYEASKSGRNWLGSNMSDPSKVRRAGGIRTPAAVVKQWGARNGSYGCQNQFGTLCDGSGCAKK